MDTRKLVLAIIFIAIGVVALVYKYYAGAQYSVLPGLISIAWGLIRLFMARKRADRA